MGQLVVQSIKNAGKTLVVRDWVVKYPVVANVVIKAVAWLVVVVQGRLDETGSVVASFRVANVGGIRGPSPFTCGGACSF